MSDRVPWPDQTPRRGRELLADSIADSQLAFPEALVSLKDLLGLSYREIARRSGLTHATINMAVNRHYRISFESLAKVATACGVRPSYFAEYRLWHFRSQFDPDVVGFAQALANFNDAQREQ